MEFLVVLLLVLFNGLFSMAEMAVVAARKSRLRDLAEKGTASARTALKLAENPDVFLSTIQVGITAVGIASGAFSGHALAEPVALLLERVPQLRPFSMELSFVLVIGTVTYLTLVLGELVPKRLALRAPESVAAGVAPLMAFLASLARPLVKILSLSTSLILGALPGREGKEPPITEEELKMLVSEGTGAGVFRATEQELLHRVLELEELPISQLMRPRREMVWLDLRAQPAENLERIRGASHSRFPVCDGELDRVVGVALAQSLLVRNLDRASRDLVGLADDLLPPLLLPEHLSALEVLERFRHSEVHLGIVIDEHGTVRGLLTVNDIMEAIVGDLVEEGGCDDPLVIQREDGSWLLDGLLPIEDFLAMVEQEKKPGQSGYTTLAGFVIEQFGRIPHAGDHFRAFGRRFEVVDMDRHRVDKVLMELPRPQPEVEGEETE
jgi:putative hemolysin